MLTVGRPTQQISSHLFPNNTSSYFSQGNLLSVCGTDSSFSHWSWLGHASSMNPCLGNLQVHSCRGKGKLCWQASLPSRPSSTITACKEMHPWEVINKKQCIIHPTKVKTCRKLTACTAQMRTVHAPLSEFSEALFWRWTSQVLFSSSLSQLTLPVLSCPTWCCPTCICVYWPFRGWSQKPTSINYKKQSQISWETSGFLKLYTQNPVLLHSDCHGWGIRPGFRDFVSWPEGPRAGLMSGCCPPHEDTLAAYPATSPV